MNEDDTTTKLTSIDSVEFKIDARYLSLSEYLKALSEMEETDIHLPFTGRILGAAVSYLHHHEGVSPPPLRVPIQSNEMEQISRDQWDAKFADDMSIASLYDIIKMVNIIIM